jgi:hypothetical protein
MRKLASLTLAGAMALAAAGIATSANAVNFVGNDPVVAYGNGGNSSNGLDILISNPGGLNFNLNNVGDSTGYLNLFTVYTDEATWQSDDGTNHALSLALNFTAPSPGASGGFGGTTDGVFDGYFFLGFIPVGDGAYGTLGWSNTQTFLNFSSGYQLRVNLESANETFNAGNDANEFAPGPQNGALVRANFTLTALPTAVPEPATWGMMIMGFGLAGAVIRRRRSVAFA